MRSSSRKPLELRKNCGCVGAMVANHCLGVMHFCQLLVACAAAAAVATTTDGPAPSTASAAIPSASAPAPASGAPTATAVQRSSSGQRASAVSASPSPIVPSHKLVYRDVFGNNFLKHAVVFKSKPVSTDDVVVEKSQDKDAIVMAHKDAKFFCKFPAPRITSQRPAHVDRPTHSQEEKKSVHTQAFELLNGLKKRCLSYTSNWWTYSYCHGQNITQSSKFPESLGFPQLHYVLGKFSSTPSAETFYGDPTVAATAGAELLEYDDAGRKYLRVWYGDGDVCADNGIKRIVQIQFSCCQHDHIVSVSEITLCQYVMKIHTKYACDALFESDDGLEQPENEEIVCRPILSDREIHLINHDETMQFASMFNQLAECEGAFVDCLIAGNFGKSTGEVLEATNNAIDMDDVFEGAESAGIHPMQQNVEEDAFDTEWLDIYDPIELEQEEVSRVIDAANFILFGNWVGTDNAKERDVTPEVEQEIGVKEGSGESDAGVERVRSKDEVVEMMKQRLREVRADVWRILVARHPGSRDREEEDPYEAQLRRAAAGAGAEGAEGAEAEAEADEHDHDHDLNLEHKHAQ
ncbi:Protein OS-9 [Entophlyctis sp. JEL0112]|nr:Protein OS-9 [Entophlyctis sp. JEL0112]